MPKKNKGGKSSQFPSTHQPQPSTPPVSPTPPPAATTSIPREVVPLGQSPSASKPTGRVQPEQLSLLAHDHIQKLLNGRDRLSKGQVTSVQQLSQHLRVHGLLSAAAFFRQTNSQEGKNRQANKEVWEVLLGHLVNHTSPPKGMTLTQVVQKLASDTPPDYLVLWRKSLLLTNHWNFWAKAYEE